MTKRTMMALVSALTVSTAAWAGHGHDGRGSLPPGLQKKLDRGEALPPGWQDRVDYHRGDHLDEAVIRYGHVYDIDGRRERVEVEDRVYTILKDTREIVDILKGER
ncbi:hypothetical protein [Marinobacter sp. C2H3]|uniref:hypothetical protein n=1 Tax=Marinobacter sp. C2H3 TaxID=3119003 RepID=UPI00300E984E